MYLAKLNIYLYISLDIISNYGILYIVSVLDRMRLEGERKWP